MGSSGLNLVDTYHVYNIARLASPSNPINGITTNTLANIDARVQYLGYIAGGLTGTAFDGKSNYNSLQVTVRKAILPWLHHAGIVYLEQGSGRYESVGANASFREQR